MIDRHAERNEIVVKAWEYARLNGLDSAHRLQLYEEEMSRLSAIKAYAIKSYSDNSPCQ